MRIINKTTIPNEVLRAAVRAVCPSNVSKFTLTVTNANGYQFRGLAYTGSNRVLIRVARTNKEAQLAYREKTPGKGYIEGYNVGSRMEALLKVLAHELRHLWQVKVKRGWRVWGARGQFSERDADAYAIQMVRRYRRGELPDLAGVTLGDCPKAVKAAAKKAAGVPKAKRTSPREKLAALVQKHGGTYEHGDIDAPKGFVWHDTGSHHITAPEAGGDYSYRELYDILSMGVCACDCPDCTEPDEAVAA